MIKANELRIGNWVNVGAGYRKIQSIGGEFCHTDALHSYDFVYPIQLSPEILEKCGFVRKVEYGMDTWEIKISESCVLQWHDDGSILFAGTNELGWMLNASDQRFKHLHQLQNLYFCLCGEELNIEL